MPQLSFHQPPALPPSPHSSASLSSSSLPPSLPAFPARSVIQPDNPCWRGIPDLRSEALYTWSEAKAEVIRLCLPRSVSVYVVCLALILPLYSCSFSGFPRDCEGFFAVCVCVCVKVVIVFLCIPFDVFMISYFHLIFLSTLFLLHALLVFCLLSSSLLHLHFVFWFHCDCLFSFLFSLRFRTSFLLFALCLCFLSSSLFVLHLFIWLR